MPVVLVAEKTITVGQAVMVEGASTESHFAAVFEDDGQTGYFYGLDVDLKDQPIVDARHIYDVKQVTDRSIPSLVQIAFSLDGQKVVLMINQYPHAIIDFAGKRTYCRTGFPAPKKTWSTHDATWTDEAMEVFR